MKLLKFYILKRFSCDSSILFLFTRMYFQWTSLWMFELKLFNVNKNAINLFIHEKFRKYFIAEVWSRMKVGRRFKWKYSIRSVSIIICWTTGYRDSHRHTFSKVRLGVGSCVGDILGSKDYQWDGMKILPPTIILLFPSHQTENNEKRNEFSTEFNWNKILWFHFKSWKFRRA